MSCLFRLTILIKPTYMMTPPPKASYKMFSYASDSDASDNKLCT